MIGANMRNYDARIAEKVERLLEVLTEINRD
jgi:hypothetical protein